MFFEFMIACCGWCVCVRESAGLLACLIRINHSHRGVGISFMMAAELSVVKGGCV